MNFQESVDYLYSLGNEVSAMKLGLENIRKLLAALRNPQNKYLKVQVAGTNGKGSVCAFLNSICLHAGIKTGMYTSPHLISITERIYIGGVAIDEPEFGRLATHVREASEKLFALGEIENTPTFFEQVTAIALLAFAEAEVELAILETGLGGRLDATTAANAEIAAITRIDIDHQEYLGETLEEIAAEKAAIINSESIVVVGEQQPNAIQVIAERCRRVGVVPRFTSEIMAREGPPLANVSDLPKICFVGSDGKIRGLRLGLRGRHQVENARIAMLVVEELTSFFPINDTDIINGLHRARHRGRLEWITPQILLDGAHNLGGARALSDFLDEFEDRRITMIFGAMSDKQVAEIAAVLFPMAEKLILTRATNPRAIPAEELRELVTDSISTNLVFLTSSPEDAIAKALEISTVEDVIVVTGSLYLVGEALAHLTSGETEN